MDSGLTLYRSVFLGPDGSTGIVAGPHASFTEVNTGSHFVLGHSYYSSQVRAYFDHISNTQQVPLLGFKDPITNSDHLLDYDDPMFCDFGLGEGDLDSPEYRAHAAKKGPQKLKTFEEVENTGTIISYRCID